MADATDLDRDLDPARFVTQWFAGRGFHALVHDHLGHDSVATPTRRP